MIVINTFRSVFGGKKRVVEEEVVEAGDGDSCISPPLKKTAVSNQSTLATSACTKSQVSLSGKFGNKYYIDLTHTVEPLILNHHGTGLWSKHKKVG